MKIILSFHALQRMEERGITSGEVEETVTFPEKISRNNEVSIAMKRRKNGRLLIIIFVDTEDVRKIITVIDTSKVTKYL